MRNTAALIHHFYIKAHPKLWCWSSQYDYITVIFLCARLSHTVTLIYIQITSKKYKDLGRCFLPTKEQLLEVLPFLLPLLKHWYLAKKKKKCKLNFQSKIQLVNKEFTLSELNYSIFLEHMVGNKNIYNVKSQRHKGSW